MAEAAAKRAAPVEEAKAEAQHKRSLPAWRMPQPFTTLADYFEEHKPLHVMNSLTRSKVPLLPMQGKRLLWYMCGPTVYDSAHMGHARTYVSFDYIRRILRDYFGYQITLVMNITDIDDKIIARSNERNVPFTDLARQYEQEFLDDMGKLGVEPPDVLTRVSEYIPAVIDMISRIIKNGFGYESNGSVYFDTVAYDKRRWDYGKLFPEKLGNEQFQEEGEGALSRGTQDKRNPCDFALWKASRPEEPSWDSPWGKGRPGWHIECSAMVADTLGDVAGGQIDIHSGGVDLKFPHHENEIAQAEAAYGLRQWCNYWLHSGHLNIDGLKMSKSLKNFIKINDTLQRYTCRQLRLLFLQHRYNAPMDYSEETMEQALIADRIFSEFFQNLKSQIRAASIHAPQRWDAKEKELRNTLMDIENDVHKAFCDDLNTPAVLHSLRRLVTAVNKYVADTTTPPVRLLLKAVGDFVTRIFKTLGLIDPTPSIGFSLDANQGSLEEEIAPFLDALTQFREKVRDGARAGDLQTVLQACDDLRDNQLPDLGVRLEDTKPGQPAVWKLVDKETLAREKALEEEEKKAKEEAKEARRRQLEEQQKEKAAKAAIHPADMFKQQTDLYSKFDEQGIPTHDAEGNELNKNQKKKAMKAYAAQLKKYEKAMKK